MNNHVSNGRRNLDLTEQALPWQDMIASVYRHRRMVAAILSAGIAVATMRAWLLPPTYEAESLIMVVDQRARVRVTPDKNATALIDRAGQEQINSVTALLRDVTLVREVLEDREASGKTARQVERPGGLLELPSLLYRRLHDVADPSELEKRAQLIANDIIVEPVPRSNLIRVGYASENPVWAANLINQLVAKLTEKYTTLYENEGAQEFYHAQREVLREKLEGAQLALTTFRENVGTELLTESDEQVRQRIGELEASLVQSRTQLAELRVRADAPIEAMLFSAEAGGGARGTSGNPAVTELKNRLVTLELSRSEMLSRYTPGSVAVRDLDRQIAQAKRLLDDERSAAAGMHRKDILSQIEAVNARLGAIVGQLSDYRAKIAMLEEVAPEWQRLNNEVEAQREAYLTYLRKEEEARFANALDDSQIINITVAEPARVPHQPKAPQMPRMVLLGALVSLMVGIALSLVRDWVDPSVKSSKQAERLAGVPVLGEIQS